MGVFEGNQFMFLVLTALVISGALRVGFELRRKDTHGHPAGTSLSSLMELRPPDRPCRDVVDVDAATGQSGAGIRQLGSSSSSSSREAADFSSSTADRLLRKRELNPDDPLAGLPVWHLPKTVTGDVFPPNSRMDPSLFRLHIKVLAFDRADSILRSLESLANAQYGGDPVSLDVFVDHTFSDGSGRWTRQALRRVEASHDLLLRLDAFRWPHGEMRVHARARNNGIQPQWLEAWWPESVNDFALVVEDDMEVSPLFYTYFKRFVATYYYDAGNFEPHVFGISFQRQTFVPGQWGYSMHAHEQPFMYELVGTWGQFLFPLQWRQFRLWYDHCRFNETRDPALLHLKTTQWWLNKGNKLWTPWIIKWAYAYSMYTIYPAFPSNLSLSVSHRDKGSNFPRSRGVDSELLTLIPNDNDDEVYRWWVAPLPPTSAVERHDLCFRPVPLMPPATRVGHMKALLDTMKLESKRVALLVVPRGGLDLARNWLCHLDGAQLRNFILVVSCAYQASVLSAMGHAVFHIRSRGGGREETVDSGGSSSGGGSLSAASATVAAELEAAASVPDRTAAKASAAATAASGVGTDGRNEWTAAHAGVVLSVLALGYDVLLCSPDAIWIGNPLAGDWAKDADVAGHLNRINFSDSLLFVRSTQPNMLAWGRLRNSWQRAEEREKGKGGEEEADGAGARSRAVSRLQQSAQGLILGGEVSFQDVATLVVGEAGWGQDGPKLRPLVVPAVRCPPLDGGSRMGKIECLKRAGLWVIDDFDLACKAVTCRRRLQQ